MDFASISDQARQLRARFAEFEQRRYGRQWTPAEIMLGLVGDVGDLAKLIQGKEGVRPTADLDAKLGHELADCLWAVLTVADYYSVDLESAFDSTMNELNNWLDHAERDGAPHDPE